MIQNLYRPVKVERRLGSEGIIGIGYCSISTNEHSFIVVGGIVKFNQANQGFMLKLSKDDGIDKLERVLRLIKKDIESLEGDICFFKSNSKIKNKELKIFIQNLLKLAPKLTIHDSAGSPYVDISQTDNTDNRCFLKKVCDKGVSPEDPSGKKKDDKSKACSLRESLIYQVLGQTNPARYRYNTH